MTTTMAMASLPSQPFGHAKGHAKITKTRNRPAVKPILKKLQSHSEKNSLDLDRGWEDQTYFTYAPYSPDGEDGTASPTIYGTSYTPSTAGHGPRPTRDVSFSISATDVSSGGARVSKYSHARSTSGTSHASNATSTSGRNGSFIHPFQQTPRNPTPPLSYANSLASLDNSIPHTREYSPTITEDDDDFEAPTYPAPRSYPLQYSQPHPRRPSLASQRTSSLSDVTQGLRIINNRSNTGGASRIGRSSLTQSRSDLQLNTASATVAVESPLTGTSPPKGSCTSPQMATSMSTSSNTPLSPLRTSLDMSGFRIRSRSEVDTASRQDQVREARRKFEEKERAKEEKYAREQSRKRERADHREQHRLRKSHDHNRNVSLGFSSGRESASLDIRPSVSRKTTATALGDTINEKHAFATQGYDDVHAGQEPHARTEDVHFQSTRRKNTKRKTTGTWTAFVLWLRTRLLKLGRR